MCMEKNPMRQAKKKARKPLILLGLRAIEFWCRWWDSNPHTLADNRFWVCLVCQFRHTGIYIFKSYPGWSLWEIGGPSWGDIKNHLHIELSNFLEKSRASAEVVTTDEWDFESSASANSATAAQIYNASILPYLSRTCKWFFEKLKKWSRKDSTGNGNSQNKGIME